MAITYPSDCTTPEAHLGYIQRLKELIKRLHNGFNKWKDDGLTQTQYDKFPAKVKQRYPYVFKISKADWDDFNQNILDPLNDKWVAKLTAARDECNNSIKWPIDLGEI